MKYEIGKLEQGEKELFEKMNKGWKCTGETLKETWEKGSQTLVVFKGRSTAWGMCRDCGDHYIIARWDRYDRIDKGTFKVTRDVEDR